MGLYFLYENFMKTRKGLSNDIVGFWHCSPIHIYQYLCRHVSFFFGGTVFGGHSASKYWIVVDIGVYEWVIVDTNGYLWDKANNMIGVRLKIGGHQSWWWRLFSIEIETFFRYPQFGDTQMVGFSAIFFELQVVQQDVEIWGGPTGLHFWGEHDE